MHDKSPHIWIQYSRVRICNPLRALPQSGPTAYTPTNFWPSWRFLNFYPWEEKLLLTKIYFFSISVHITLPRPFLSFRFNAFRRRRAEPGIFSTASKTYIVHWRRRTFVGNEPNGIVYLAFAVALLIAWAVHFPILTEIVFDLMASWWMCLLDGIVQSHINRPPPKIYIIGAPCFNTIYFFIPITSSNSSCLVFDTPSYPQLKTVNIQ